MLDPLIEKYSLMLRMRERDLAGDVPDPRAEMASLARRFPGALREIDERPIDDIRGRLEQLRAASAGRAEVPQWAALQTAYHGAMRAFLRVRPLLRGRTEGQARECVASSYRPASPDEPAVDVILGPLFAQLYAPPEGRLNPVVFSYVAALHGVTPAAVSDALFRPSSPAHGAC